MSKNIVGIGVAVIALALIGGIVLINNKDDTKTTTPSSNTTQSQAAHEDMPQTASPQSATAETTDQVTIKAYAFGPSKITVKVGTKVTWTNQDSVKHTVTPDNDSPDFTASELFGKGESYSFTFTKAGTYAYHCEPHPYMKATVEVTD